MKTNNPARIQHLSQRLDQFIKALFIITPIATAFYCFGFNVLPHHNLIFETYGITELTLQNRSLLFIANLLPLSIALWCLWMLHKLFALFAEKIFYHQHNVKRFRALGLGLIAWVICDFILTPVRSVILTLNQPEGSRVIALNFELNDMIMLLAGIVTILLAWVVDEGRKIKEENLHTI